MSLAPPRARHPLDTWRRGDEWVHAVTGVRLRVERSAAEAGGDGLAWRATFPAGSPEPPEHLHPHQQEQFTVLAGTLRFVIDGQPREAIAGEVLEIAPGQRHRMWNPHPQEAVVRWETTPALRTERWMAMLLALAAAGRLDRRGVPGFWQLAVLLQAYRHELRLTQPPQWVQVAVLWPVAFLGRLAGLCADGSPPSR